MAQNERDGDAIVNTVLDVLVDMTSYHPCSIFPEHSLTADLQLSKSQLLEFGQRLESALPLPKSLTPAEIERLTLRELVVMLKSELKQEPIAA